MKQTRFVLENPPRYLHREEARAKFEELKRTLENLPTDENKPCEQPQPMREKTENETT